MLKQQDYILNTEEEYRLIGAVKSQIKEIHASGNFFQLPLKTLELIRRFNLNYSKVFEELDESSSSFNQLVIISRSLEKEFLRNDFI